MKKKVITLSIYTLFWLFFFIIARLFFIIFQYHNAAQNTIGELFATFCHGLALDISTTGYFLLIPVLGAVAGTIINGSWYKILLKWYSRVLIVISSIIVVADANLYSYWGFRMDYTPMLYLKTPGEAMASVGTLKLIMFFVTIILMSAFFIFIYNRFIVIFFHRLKRTSLWWAEMLFFTVLLGALIIPIRGGFGVAPINAGSVYFSKKMFLNHSSINAVWNVGTSAFTQKPDKNPYEFGDPVAAATVVKNLTIKRGITEKVLNNDKPDILFIILESFSGYLIGPLGGDSLVTPNFNRYIKEGILFSGFYASGTRTDKAMPAIFNGYPAQPAQSIIKEPKKTQSLPSLIKIFEDKGYKCSFWYGGEINFANFNSYVIGSGFTEIVTKKDFDPINYNSKWGVHDHVMFAALKDSMRTMKEPFFKVVLTLSSHEPFDVPMDPVFSGSDNLAKYKNSVYYADKALGNFLDWAKGTEWWKNTLVILVADHCCHISSDIPIYSQNVFKIPMLWTGGAVSKKNMRIEKLGSQVDIPSTLIDQLGLDGSFPFGKDLLSDGSGSFAFYTFNEGFGFITDSSAYIYDQKLKKPVVSEGKHPESAESNGKAYLQVLFDDYLKR